MSTKSKLDVFHKDMDVLSDMDDLLISVLVISIEGNTFCVSPEMLTQARIASIRKKILPLSLFNGHKYRQKTTKNVR